jgi:hypothetical protein
MVDRLSQLKYPVWNLWKQSVRITMAKKKSSKPKKPAAKKNCGKKSVNKSCETKCDNQVSESPSTEIVAESKCSYLLRMIRKILGYE